MITPEYHGKKFLKDYLDSLLKQTHNEFRIIVIDNSADNESIKYLEENYHTLITNGKLKIIKNQGNFGFAKANNQGIKEAFKDPECEYVICLNNDTITRPDFIENLIKMAEKHPNAGSIQARMIWGQNPELIDSTGLEYSKNGLGFNRGAYKAANEYNEEAEILGCCAGACLYRRKALEDIEINGEYFDEDFFAYYEDFDLALRLRLAGWKSYYCPNAIVYHHKGASKGILSDFTIYHNWRNYTWTYFKNMPKILLIEYLPLFLLTELLQIMLNLKRRKWIILRAKYDAYKNIRSIIKKRKLIKKRTNYKKFKNLLILKWQVKVP